MTNEKAFPPRVWVTENGHVHKSSVNLAGWNIKNNEYLSKQEHDAIVAPLLRALEFTLHAAEYVYRPDRPLREGLDPSFYHTLTHEGDLELIRKCKEAREALAAHAQGREKTEDLA